MIEMVNLKFKKTTEKKIEAIEELKYKNLWHFNSKTGSIGGQLSNTSEIDN